MKETLKNLRTENRYSQELLAKILGVSRLSYMKYESGEVEPPVEIIRKLTKIYKVSYKTLIDNELNAENKSANYKYGHISGYEVANPTPAYCGDVFSKPFQVDNSASLSNLLTNLQNTILVLQVQLNALQKAAPSDTGSFSKSASFNKENFFAQIEKVQINSSYIEELRGASLI